MPRLGTDDVFKEVVIEKEPELLEIILIDHVSGIGVKGDIVKVEEKQPGGPSSALSPITAQKLQEKIFLLTMSNTQEWTIEKKHIRISLRRQNVIVPEDAIELPESEINGPNIGYEGKDIIVHITINRNSYEKIPVRFMVHHLNSELESDWHNKRPRAILLKEQEELNRTLPEPPVEEVLDVLSKLK